MPASLVSIEEPVKLERFQPTYKVAVKVPIDVSGISLDDAATVLVRLTFQNDPESTEVFLVAPDPLFGPALWSSLKEKPGDLPTKLNFTPPFPGFYTVTLAAVTVIGGLPVRAAWKTAPIRVQA